jgi:putative peptide modification system cyclase
MNEFAQAGFDPASSPQVRTLLLTDLCDSTLLVERLGDGPAAVLFRAHDRLVLELQQRWRGRLIDRSDGLLLLFERPVDGLGFALDYSRGLRELADRPEVRDRKLALLARAGLHVGEVLTWQNSEAAVHAGAKPLEVEGLAKPLAGRLMTLARPGQILLSATAEPLARRAARELGDRAQNLIWKSHGRWRFKGVPDGQEVFEVGEPGFAPLRAPKGTGGKAWRDIPVWRRPPALAAEMFLVAGIATGAWFLTRPTPAIAFNERDWVVVGDLRNLTGDAVLDESLEQAFRISLEQSRYVNVVSDLKVRDTLSLMKRKPGTLLDRAVASEIAIRDGARAVILPTVAEVGGRVRVSAEVVDPHTQTTVYAESADGVGAPSTLESIDKVTGELREKLGEAIASIDRDSEPLPQVSTENLDALKAYALGEKKRFEGDTRAALGYYQQAFALDPEFALAQAAIGRMYVGQRKMTEGKAALQRALQMHEHLTPREALTLEATLARFGPVIPLLGQWQRLIEMYPDQLAARFGYAQDAWMMANRYGDVVSHAKASAAPQSPYFAMGNYLEGILELGDEDYDRAMAAFQTARRKGYMGAGASYAYVYEVKRDYATADRTYAAHGGSNLAEGLEDIDFAFTMAVDRGELTRARELHAKGLPLTSKEDPLVVAAPWRFWGLGLDLLQGTPDDAVFEREFAWVDAHANDLDALYRGSPDFRTALGYLAARAGKPELLQRAIAGIGDPARLKDDPMRDQAYQVLLAERDRLAGKNEAAIDRLAPIARRPDALAMVHSSYARALAAAGRYQAARDQARWLATHRGRVFVERGVSSLLDPVNIADTTLAELDAAEWSKRIDDERAAKAAADRFGKAWQVKDLPRATRARFDAL